MSSHNQIKKQVRQCFEQITGSKLNSVKVPGRKFRDLFSVDDNSLIIMRYSKFLPDKPYPYFYGISYALIIWALEETRNARVWFIFDDAKHIAIMDAQKLGLMLHESAERGTAYLDERYQFKILVTDDYLMRMDSESPLIDLKDCMLRG